MVARAAIAHCRTIGDEVIGLGRDALDISDASQTLKTLEDLRPNAVINCAAYTNVDGAETDRESATRANADGPENLALACRAVDAGFVTISTDYVFDGLNDGFYTQRDTPRPLGFYGVSKLEGERRAAAAYARTIIVRSGWIFGSGGTNFLSVMPGLLAAGKSITAIGDSYGTPTYAADLAKRLRELAALDIPGIFHVTNAGGGASFVDFAREICGVRGYDDSLVAAVSADELQRPAPRPASSKLACLYSAAFGLEPLPHWKEALRSFIDASL